MKVKQDGQPIDATFGVDDQRGVLSITFDSNSGKRGTPSARNADYATGLELVLERLKDLNASVSRVVLHPANGREGSALQLDRYPTPLHLAAVEDIPKLRLAISAAQQNTDRKPRAKGGGNGRKRLRIYVDIPAAIDASRLERHLAGEAPRRYWALFADPKVFKIDDYLSDLIDGNWTTKGKEIRAGDRALIWRGSGGGRAERGVVAFADVLSDPVSMKDPDTDYWVDPARASAAEDRVQLRFIRPAGLPLLEAGARHELVGQLPVARARGGTVFEVAPELWNKVVEAAGGWTTALTLEGALAAQQPDVPSPARPRPVRRGQGFGLTQPERNAVDKRAMAVATDLLARDGWVVRDVSLGNCYDLHCSRGTDVLRVEVKGTTGLGEKVFLTRNEVAHAREQFPNVALIIISNIELERGLAPDARGGTARLLKPWRIDEGQLAALAFDYTVPDERTR